MKEKHKDLQFFADVSLKISPRQCEGRARGVLWEITGRMELFCRRLSKLKRCPDAPVMLDYLLSISEREN